MEDSKLIDKEEKPTEKASSQGPAEEKKENESANKGSYLKLLFELDDFTSIVIVSFAIITSLLSGAAMMVFEFLLSHFIGTLTFPVQDETDYVHKNLISFMYMMIDFIAAFVLNTLSFYLTKYHGKLLTNHIKKKYFEYVLKQNQSWFDSQNVSEITSRFESNANTIDYAVSFLIIFVVRSTYFKCFKHGRYPFIRYYFLSMYLLEFNFIDDKSYSCAYIISFLI